MAALPGELPALSPAELEAYLHAKIPLSAAMGARVLECGAARLVLEAPLAPNINHLGTVFGGSLHALPTLACYAGLWTLLRAAGMDVHVVVKSSAADYRVPVTGDPRAVWHPPRREEIDDFLHTLRRRGRARISLTAAVEAADGGNAVEYRGVFVAVT